MTPFDALVARLVEALAVVERPIDAQQRFSPRLRDGSVVPRQPGERQAAALLLLFPRAAAAHVVLTVRASNLPHHAGQVSLPGGRIEPDETIEAAALREAQEEVGLDPAGVRILGQLSPVHIPVSRFTLHVVVGTADEAPVLTPDPAEVAELLEVALDTLADPATLRAEVWPREAREIHVPYFALPGGHRVWGATAMALGECLVLCGFDLDPWRR